jgi:hypothetical protein
MTDLPSGSIEPSTLELRYRRLLRVLPRPYREAREQEMVDTFLDSEFGADPENADLTAKFGGVGPAETLSVLALALRLRWADPVGPERYRIRLSALRIALVAALAMLAAWAVILVCGALWTAWWSPPVDDAVPAGTPVSGAPDELWQVINRWAFVLWIPALVLAIRGGRRATWWAAALSAVPAALPVVLAVGYPLVAGEPVVLAATKVAVLVGLAALAATDATTSIPQLRTWLIAAAAVIVAINAYVLLVAIALSAGEPPGWLSTLGWIVGFGTASFVWSLVVISVGTTFLIGAASGHRVDTASVLALAWLAGVVTLQRAARLVDVLAGDWSPVPAALAASVAVQLGLAAAITVTAGTVAVLRIRRMPAVRYVPAGPTGPTLTA